MKTVILCDQLGRLKPILSGVSGPLRYIGLVDTEQSIRICNYLSQKPNSENIPRSQGFHKYSEKFRKQYIESMGRVNARNHSIHWWAMPFTSKNPLATPLCRSTFEFLLIVELMRSKSDPLVVITDNTDLAAQVETWGRKEGVQTINAVKPRWTWERTIKEFMPGAVLAACLKTLWIWALVRSCRPQKDTQGEHTLVATLFHTQSFIEPGKYRDVYFGRLVDDLENGEAKALVVGLIQERWRDQLPRLKSLPSRIPVVPLETYLTLGDLIVCAVQALKAYFRPVRIQGPVDMGFVDLNFLVRRAIRQACHSGNFFMSLRVYYAAKRLAQTARVTRCLYPYENRSWEKMLILGLRSDSSETQMLGYQHSSVTLSHTNFILGKEESEITPLPNKILTTGTVVKEWLEREGNYPPGMVKAACALRQGQPVQAPEKKRKPQLNNVLVALATSLQEYVNTLVFLEKAFTPRDSYLVRVRPHPSMPLEWALNLVNLSRSDFYSPSTGALLEDLQWADVVLYASSTVGLEALFGGTPAIHLEVGDFFETDPMFGWNEFKWSVQEPSELINTIQRIAQTPEDEFKELQEKGKQYAAAYLSPVTASGLQTFWES